MYGLTHHVARQRMRLRGFRSRYYDTSVGRVHALDAQGQGDLPPIVLLHGLSAASHHFGQLLTSLRRQSRRVTAPDLPGHGFSETPRGTAPVRAMHTGLVEALDQLIDEPVVLFGSSLGGFAAVRYAAEHPEKVRGLVLCSPGGAAMSQEVLEAFLSGFRLDTHDQALHFVDRFMARRTWLRPLLAWGVRQSMGHPNIGALLDDMTSDALLAPEHLAGLQMPILLLWGQAEKVLPAESYQFFRKHLPGHAEVERPPHYGHAPYLEHPGCVSNKLLGFMQRVGGESPVAPPRPIRARQGSDLKTISPRASRVRKMLVSSRGHRHRG